MIPNLEYYIGSGEQKEENIFIDEIKSSMRTRQKERYVRNVSKASFPLKNAVEVQSRNVSYFPSVY